MYRLVMFFVATLLGLCLATPAPAAWVDDLGYYDVYVNVPAIAGHLGLVIELTNVRDRANQYGLASEVEVLDLLDQLVTTQLQAATTARNFSVAEHNAGNGALADHRLREAWALSEQADQNNCLRRGKLDGLKNRLR